LAAGLKIVWDVLVFRLRKLEMANLAGAVAIMLVLRLTPEDVLVRTLFAGMLNVLVYLNNDYLDVAIDAGAPDKDAAKVAFLRAHMGAAVAAQLALCAALIGIAALHSRGLLVVLALGGGICWAYSAKLKHTALLDVLAMAAWGVVMPLSGSPLDSALGLALVVQLGLMSSVFEPIQTMRDHDADRELGIRTTAVVLGVPRTLVLTRALMLLCAGYAGLVLHPLSGGLALLALLIPFDAAAVERYWTRVKLAYGMAWLTACAACFVQGGSEGLLFSVDAAARLPVGAWR
jgi:4-hydroxybenzoate polyprenyltransferase